MRKLILLIFLVGAIHALALDNHFIYIQSENGKPFYLSLNSKVYSSSSTGWLILPLAEGEYQCNIGFPRNEWPDYRFKFRIDKRDMGFVLKNLGDQGWGLQNIQSMELTRGALVESASALRGNSGAMSSDPFSTMLAAVVDDPTIRQHPYVPIEEKNTTTPSDPVAATDSAKLTGNSTQPAPAVTAASAPAGNAPAVTTTTKPAKKGGKISILATKKVTTKKSTAPASDSTTVKDSLSSKSAELAVTKPAPADSSLALKGKPGSAAPVSGNPTSAKAAPLLAPGIHRTFQSNGIEGIDLTYLDRSPEGRVDTIRIFISKKVEEPPKQQPATQHSASAQKDPKFLDMSVYPKTLAKDSVGTAKPAAATAQPLPRKADSVVSALPQAVATNPNCKAVANDDDLFKLKKKIISKKDEDEMVSIVLKEFKLRCYSADKVRRLSYNFSSQKGKYQLLDAAYPYVYDPSNFKGLSDILTDSYYINRFNALIQ